MLTNQVKEIMSTDLVCVQRNQPLSVFEKHFKKRGIHHILVEDKEGTIVGIISSEDAARSKSWIVKDKVLAEHIMSENPLTINEHASVDLAKAHFLENRYRALPVENDQGEVIGIVTPYDLLTKIT